MEKYSEFHGLEGLVWRDLGRMFGPESEWDESDDGFERDDADLHDSDIPGSEMTGGRADPGEFADAESSADTAAHVLGNPPWHLEGGTSLDGIYNVPMGKESKMGEYPFMHMLVLNRPITVKRLRHRR